jgi:hypothetical protein
VPAGATQADDGWLWWLSGGLSRCHDRCGLPQLGLTLRPWGPRSADALDIAGQLPFQARPERRILTSEKSRRYPHHKTCCTWDATAIQFA